MPSLRHVHNSTDVQQLFTHYRPQQHQRQCRGQRCAWFFTMQQLSARRLSACCSGSHKLAQALKTAARPDNLVHILHSSGLPGKTTHTHRYAVNTWPKPALVAQWDKHHYRPQCLLGWRADGSRRPGFKSMSGRGFLARLGQRACYEIKFSNKHRGFVCVLIKLWQAIMLRNKSTWDRNKYGWSDNR